MCGICGEVSFDSARRVSGAAVARMTERLCHRGPDHAAAFTAASGAAGLGFRRLSIMDLRSVAHQPIGNEDGAIQLIFNGEIYNYRELRRMLVANGHHFRSDSDSEVIVHLFEERGERAVDALEGMFALAVWDSRTETLTLARDRAGKKPLFLWQDASRLVFASEIKALLAHPDLDLTIDREAVPYYFLYGYVPHPQTFYRGVTQLAPGSVATFDRAGRRADRKYWQLTFPPEGHISVAPSRANAARTVRELVTAAVERRLMSDVPLGAFLSGGIDSAVIVGVMQRLLREPVRTFTIGFEGDDAFDETRAARETAQWFGTRHTEFRVRPSAVDLLDTLVYHHDGPFADSSAIPTYLVSKLTREHVTVALTGDGADEVFAGYLRFGAALAAERLPASPARVLTRALDLLPAAGNERHPLARARRFARHMSLPLHDRLTAWAGVFFDDVEDLLGLPKTASRIDRRRHLRNLSGAEGSSALSQLLAANFHSYLHDDLLVKTDRMTMAHSLEARAPFLDHTLVEYVAALPDEYKRRRGVTKVVLREAFDDILPEAVKRGGKKGFGVPLDAWFRGPLRELVHDTLLGPSARLRQYVDQDYVRILVDAHLAGQRNHGHRLWTLLTFERWLALLPTWPSHELVEMRRAAPKS